MAEFDIAWDIEIEVEEFILNKLKKLIKFKGNEYNYSGEYQCLEVFNNIIYGIENYKLSDELCDFFKKLLIKFTDNNIIILDKHHKVSINRLKKWLKSIAK